MYYELLPKKRVSVRVRVCPPISNKAGRPVVVPHTISRQMELDFNKKSHQDFQHEKHPFYSWQESESFYSR